jgi:hypothetical protein
MDFDATAGTTPISYGPALKSIKPSPIRDAKDGRRKSYPQGSKNPL